MQRNNDITAVVRKVLKESEESRNSDQLLTLKVWWEISPSSFKQFDDKWWVMTEAIQRWLPQENTVKRIRAKIQNEEKELVPTNEGVRLKRSRAKRDQESLSRWENQNSV